MLNIFVQHFPKLSHNLMHDPPIVRHMRSHCPLSDPQKKKAEMTRSVTSPTQSGGTREHATCTGTEELEMMKKISTCTKILFLVIAKLSPCAALSPFFDKVVESVAHREQQNQ